MRKLMCLVMSLLGVSVACSNDNIAELNPKDFNDAIHTDTTAVVVDVRTLAEYAEGHIKETSYNIDWTDGEDFVLAVRKLDKSKTYYIYCRSGRRSRAAALQMQADSFKVVNLKGGINQWISDGLPVTK